MIIRKPHPLSSLGRLGLALALALVLTLLTSPVVLAAYLQIDGDPLDIEAEDDGQMAVYYEGQYQYYGIYAKGSFLFLNGTDLDFDFGSGPAKSCDATYQFTPVSHTQTDDWTLETVFDAATTGVRITQIVEYINGNKYYKITWQLANTGSETYTDNRFIHGGDTYFAGYDSSRGNWDSALGMVYLTNPDMAVAGIMGLYAAPSSPADHYFEGGYSNNWQEMCSGRLPDTVDTSYIDAGYSLEWDRATLAPGDEWVIVAYEKWTEAGFVQVFAPPGQSGDPGDVFAYNFTLQNLQTFEDTFDLVATSSESWGVSLPGGDNVTIAAGATETVGVTLNPGGACGVDTLTLTATSQTASNVTNSDSVNTDIPCPMPAVGGEAFPINKLIILAPWFALAATIVTAGVSIFMRRRRA